MNLAALPEKLTTDSLFCTWRYEERNGKMTKVPYNPLSGNHAQSNDPGCFVPFQTAASATGYDGIGVGIFGDLCAIDLDHCLEGNTLSESASDIINLMHSYTEISPSGDGIHILFRAPGFKYDSDQYYIMNRNAGIEVYVAGATRKYVTVTGNKFAEYDLEDRSTELSVLLDRYMRRKSENTVSAVPAVNAINAVYSLSDDELLKMAISAKNGKAFANLWNGSIHDFPSHSEADYALCSDLAFWTGKDASRMDDLFRKSGLMRDKWDRAQNGSTYGQITIQNAIQRCTNVYTPRKEKIKAEIVALPKPDPEPFPPIVPLKPQYCDLPAFPIDCLPPVLQEYVTAVSTHSQTSPDMASVISLGVLAVTLQGKYQVEGKPGYVEPLSLYTVVVAAPGERKSSVMREMTNVIYEYERNYNQALEPEIRKNHSLRQSISRRIAGLEKRLERKYSAQDEKELEDLQTQLMDTPIIEPVRYTTDDCSSEALTKLLSQSNGRFAVISTEGGIFDIMAGRYSSKANIDVWLKGHCGDTIRVDRVGRETEYISHPALSAILTIQPSVLEEIMGNTTMTGRGLIARFLYSSPPSQIGTRVFKTAPIKSDITEEYKNLIFRLMAIPVEDRPVTLHLSDHATELVSRCFAQHEQYLIGEGQEIADWANKYIGTILRIAGLLHAAQSDPAVDEIPASTVEKAIRIGQYFLAHARYAYSVMGTDLSIQKAQFVLAKFLKNGIREIKRSDLFQICRGKFFKKTEELFPTLDLLEDRGYLRLEHPDHPAAGRPPDVRVFLNPAAVPQEAAG